MCTSRILRGGAFTLARFTTNPTRKGLPGAHLGQNLGHPGPTWGTARRPWGALARSQNRSWGAEGARWGPVGACNVTLQTCVLGGRGLRHPLYSGCRNLPSSHLPIPRMCVVATFVLSEDTCRFEYAENSCAIRCTASLVTCPLLIWWVDLRIDRKGAPGNSKLDTPETGQSPEYSKLESSFVFCWAHQPGPTFNQSSKRCPKMRGWLKSKPRLSPPPPKTPPRVCFCTRGVALGSHSVVLWIHIGITQAHKLANMVALWNRVGTTQEPRQFSLFY